MPLAGIHLANGVTLGCSGRPRWLCSVVTRRLGSQSCFCLVRVWLGELGTVWLEDPRWSSPKNKEKLPVSSGPHLDTGPSISAHAIGQSVTALPRGTGRKREHTLSRERTASVCVAVCNTLPPCAHGNYVFTCTHHFSSRYLVGDDRCALTVKHKCSFSSHHSLVSGKKSTG